jgi:hypothetical protein
MPVSEEQLVALIKQKGGTDEQINQARAMRMMNGIRGGQGPSMGQKLGTGVHNALTQGSAMLTGVKPDNSEETFNNEIIKSMLGERAKSMFRDPLEAEKTRAQTEAYKSLSTQRGTSNQLFQEILGGDGGPNPNLPPGTTMKAGPLTIPINPKLTDTEQAAISSYDTFKPQIENIAESVNGGIFNSGMGDIGRTFKQMAVDSGIPLLTSGDPKLQAVQSELNSVRRYAFGEGGKNLTGTEKQIVFKLLDTTGKNDQQIIEDHKKAIQTLQSKKNLALGGANAAKQDIPNFQEESSETPVSDQLTPEQQAKRERLRQKYGV